VSLRDRGQLHSPGQDQRDPRQLVGMAAALGTVTVICLRYATQLITTGQLINVDGASGAVVLADASTM
jgi:phosphohistidine swiveling domain-containing protein